jgi:integrase
MLTYRAEKTGKPVTVPIHKWLETYLVNADADEPVTRMATFNDLLRSLCCRAGVSEKTTLTRRGMEQQGPKWKFVSSHTGRRTFATLLFLHGSSVTTIANLMGHSNPQVTWRNYICAEQTLDEHTLQFFN